MSAIEVSCPYKHCTAGPGMMCHTKSGEIRDEFHVVRVRKAKEEGVIDSESSTLDKLRERLG